MTNQGTIDFRGTLSSSEGLVHTLVNAYMLSAALFSCVELDIFTSLDQRPGLTLQELAELSAISRKQTQKLISFCLSVGLIRQTGEQFYNSPDAQKLLSLHSASNLCAAIGHHRKHVYPLFGQLSDSLRREAPISHLLRLDEQAATDNEFYAELDKNAREFNLFMAAMNTFSRGAGARLAQTLSERGNASSSLRILDLGGGGGQVAIELAKALPSSQITLVDLAKAVSYAREQVVSNVLSDQIACQEGDIFSTLPFAADAFDIVLISAVLGDWSLDYQSRLLANAHFHLKSDGVLVVSETLLDDDLSGPILPTLMSLYVQILTEGGENFTPQALTRLLEDNGFGNVELYWNRAAGCRDTVLAKKIES
ncbi:MULTISPECIES: methyltransferase [unclassified Paraburkholderia]|uniref:methyltransferase n=1 Tax=unclassified Paraburkholderia TaxID=2615204 RepID=UPI0016219DA8|nr:MULTISPECIES: methyltransferase [unclassified Paraburkholderia]MBB5448369.1 ubiquinone/menaquinone biosynthesis C-methylase UbiE [Paraburkholderia sp. WSM4177]MBB5488750.1 ubiquinone/menaquinone biosynthesis C-methylase UbiE [Paraburkholderia sp. WSM4180]